MKRWKSTIIRYSEADKAQFDSKLEVSKTSFYDTTEYKDAKKNYENALKAYSDGKGDIDALEIVLDGCKIIFDTILIDEPKQFMEDSGVVCKELGERVLFLDNYRETDIMDKEIIQLSTPFYFDTGTECVIITKDNYKDFDITKILVVKPEKYNTDIWD